MATSRQATSTVPPVIDLYVYVIHASHLTDRREGMDTLRTLLQASPQLRLTWEYIEDHNPDALTKVPLPELNQLVTLEPSKDERLTLFNRLLRPLTLGPLSNTLKHITAYRQIETHEKQRQKKKPTPAPAFHLILEDDVCYTPDIAQRLLHTMNSIKQTLNDWDIIFTGLPSTNQQQQPAFTSATEIYKVLPGCDSYFVHPAAASTLLQACQPIRFVANVQLSYVITTKQLLAYLYTPNLFVEGSKMGTAVSSLNPNNVLLYNAEYKKLVSLVMDDKNKSSPALQKEAEEAWNAQEYPQHPDCLYMRGLYFMKQNQFVRARQFFEEAYEAYAGNHCPLGKDSVFLNNYIELFKALQ